LQNIVNKLYVNNKKYEHQRLPLDLLLQKLGFIHIFFVYFKVNFGDTPT